MTKRLTTVPDVLYNETVVRRHVSSVYSMTMVEQCINAMRPLLRLVSSDLKITGDRC